MGIGLPVPHRGRGHLARVLSEVKQDGLEDAGTEVWLHEQLCVDRENPRRFFLPAPARGVEFDRITLVG